MNLKRKGIVAERELMHMFWKHKGWVAIRVASSGAIKYPVPDVLAANALRKLAIECKSTKSTRQYIEKKQVQELNYFAKQFAAEAWIAVRFTGGKWYFVTTEDLLETPGRFCVSKEMAESTGLSFDELLGNV